MQNTNLVVHLWAYQCSYETNVDVLDLLLGNTSAFVVFCTLK